MLIAGWIKETTETKNAALARLSVTADRPRRMTDAEIGAIVEGFGGLLGLLRGAEPQHRAEVYARIGLRQ